MLFESREDLKKLYSSSGTYQTDSGPKTLAEILGYDSGARLLIVNADDFGLCESTNRAVEDLFDRNLISSVSLLVGAAEFQQAAKILKKMGLSCSVHLALTSEWTENVIGPISDPQEIQSLVNGDGAFYDDIKDLYLQVNNDEAEKECRAQIEYALVNRLEIDHLDTHMGVMQLRPDFVDIYINLAAERALPLRMGSANLARMMSLPAEQLETARSRGVLFPDNLIYIPMSLAADPGQRFEFYDYAVKNIPPGVTEIYFHPTLDGGDYKRLTHQYSKRKDVQYESIRLWDYQYLSSGRLAQIMHDENIRMISFADLKRAMLEMKK